MESPSEPKCHKCGAPARDEQGLAVSLCEHPCCPEHAFLSGWDSDELNCLACYCRRRAGGPPEENVFERPQPGSSKVDVGEFVDEAVHALVAHVQENHATMICLQAKSGVFKRVAAEGGAKYDFIRAFRARLFHPDPEETVQVYIRPTGWLWQIGHTYTIAAAAELVRSFIRDSIMEGSVIAWAA